MNKKRKFKKKGENDRIKNHFMNLQMLFLFIYLIIDILKYICQFKCRYKLKHLLKYVSWIVFIATTHSHLPRSTTYSRSSTYSRSTYSCFTKLRNLILSFLFTFQRMLRLYEAWKRKSEIKRTIRDSKITFAPS